jgi:L-ascorbate metabolism protein UlaG (beta-lactamase superfamily)
MRLQRLTLDSSWSVDWNGLRGIIDPWLVGPEIDGFPWLNKQWHTTRPVPPEQLPDAQFILISQSYEDHCHLQTLERMDPAIPILATGKAYRKLKKHFRKRRILLIPETGKGTPLVFEGLQFQAFHPGKWLDPIYYAVMVRNTSGQVIFYAPHGFHLNNYQQGLLREQDVSLLFTTMTDFRLPAIMGGRVNPGMEHAIWLQEMLQPDWIVNTHDEQKKTTGLVAKLARVVYPDWQQVKTQLGKPFLEIPDYNIYEIDLQKSNTTP